MPTVILEHPRGRQVVEVDTPSALVDLCDEHALAVPMSCRAATCGTCCVNVIEGEELLEKPGERERDLLERLGAAGGRRFACAVHIKQGIGLVQLQISAFGPLSPPSRG